MARRYQLCVPADAAYGVTVRSFAAAAARTSADHEASVDDLRLLATELLANAVERGSPSIELAIRLDGSRWELEAIGAGDIDVPGDPGGIAIRRIDVLRGFSELTIDGDRVVCAGPLDAAH